LIIKSVHFVELHRTPHPKSDEENIQRYKQRVEADDPIAIHDTGMYYSDGTYGFSQDYTKALELWHRAGELGHAQAYCNIGNAYYYGEGVEVDKEKATYYYELAAMGGDASARHNLGNSEICVGNKERALRHWMIAVGDGFDPSLEMIKQMYSKRCATKEDYTKALQIYQVYLGEIKSKQRDEAAAADEEYRYY